MSIRSLILLFFLFIFSLSCENKCQQKKENINIINSFVADIEYNNFIDYQKMKSVIHKFSHEKDFISVGYLYYHLTLFYLEKDRDSCKYYYDQSLSYAYACPHDSLLVGIYWNAISNQHHPAFNDVLTLKKAFEVTKNHRDCNKMGFISERLGVSLYDKQPDSSLYYFEKASKIYDSLNDVRKTAQIYQNMAFICDEGLDNKSQAVVYAEKAKDAWYMINSDVDVANMLKYLGYLNGYLGDFTKAKFQTHEALEIYEHMNNEQGKAVTLLNFAKVYQYEGKYDSSIYYAQKAKAIWKNDANNSRLFNLNNFLIQVYLADNGIAECVKMIEENKRMINDNIYWKDQLDYFNHCCHFYHLQKDSIHYRMFQNKIDSIELLQHPKRTTEN